MVKQNETTDEYAVQKVADIYERLLDEERDHDLAIAQDNPGIAHAVIRELNKPK